MLVEEVMRDVQRQNIANKQLIQFVCQLYVVLLRVEDRCAGELHRSRVDDLK